MAIYTYIMTTAKPRKILGEWLFRLKAKELTLFTINGGVMFFVVYINKHVGNERQIFYAALLPFGIK